MAAAGCHGGVQLRSQVPVVRDAFAWREALDNTPASSCRGSRANTPTGGTPRSARSARHTPPTSARHGGGYTPPGSRSATPPLSPVNFAARSDGGSRGSGSYASSVRSGRNDYTTPEPSARSSDFMSVYDSTSARYSDFGTVYEDEMSGGAYAAASASFVEASGSRPGTGGRSRHRAMAAAMDAFAGASALPEEEEEGGAAVVASLDPRQVFSSARHGKHREVEAALMNGFDPSTVDAYGNTLFHVACQNGNKKVSKMAIKYGGDMDAQNHKGNTGLHFLFSYGYPEIAEYFIEKGASELVANEMGLTPREGIR
eukprot:TRINITY_DN19564_c0_g4_i1.p1 TRINITY_DN19564_c0_g4~~TRINITY_DN19564_c0_g4_i1.p1  ORF type:complete len:314 (-),score=72.88 TRINITY_DN19564_c0_g4_i1:307-1248(-)